MHSISYMDYIIFQNMKCKYFFGQYLWKDTFSVLNFFPLKVCNGHKVWSMDMWIFDYYVLGLLYMIASNTLKLILYSSPHIVKVIKFLGELDL